MGFTKVCEQENLDANHFVYVTENMFDPSVVKPRLSCLLKGTYYIHESNINLKLLYELAFNLAFIYYNYSYSGKQISQYLMGTINGTNGFCWPFFQLALLLTRSLTILGTANICVVSG